MLKLLYFCSYDPDLTPRNVLGLLYFLALIQICFTRSYNFVSSFKVGVLMVVWLINAGIMIFHNNMWNGVIDFKFKNSYINFQARSLKCKNSI